MPLVSVPFPVSAAPGQFPGEGSGDLVNVYAEKNGPELSWKRIPGLGLINTLTGYLVAAWLPLHRHDALWRLCRQAGDDLIGGRRDGYRRHAAGH
jgi:hypothetical protein